MGNHGHVLFEDLRGCMALPGPRSGSMCCRFLPDLGAWEMDTVLTHGSSSSTPHAWAGNCPLRSARFLFCGVSIFLFASHYDAKALRGAQGFRSGGEEYGLVLTVALLHGVAEEELVVDVLLSGDEGGLGKLLVVAGYFDLLAVL